MTNSVKPPSFIAVLKYRTTADGGRKNPAISGYRPTIRFSFSDFMTSGQQVFLNTDTVYPGEEVEAEITIASTDFFQNKLIEGMDFWFTEGLTIIGTGTIKRILDEKLKRPGN